MTESPTQTSGPVPATEVEPAPVGTVLRQFALSGGRSFQIVKSEGDAIRIHREHPQPERGRDVVKVSGLDSTLTEWRWPANWTPAERQHVTVSVANAWAGYHQAQQEAREAAERAAAAEREAQAA